MLKLSLFNSLPSTITDLSLNITQFKLAPKYFFSPIHFIYWKSNLITGRTDIIMLFVCYRV
jgi:hypothetical protein